MGSICIWHYIEKYVIIINDTDELVDENRQFFASVFFIHIHILYIAP
jgi:hypothetical protein